MRRMGFWSWLALILVVIGAINWGLIGLFGFNLVEAIFGAGSILTALVYTIVGIAGVGLLIRALAGAWAREGAEERTTRRATQEQWAVGGGRPDTATRVNPVQLQKYLKGVDYPATKEDLLMHAESNGADRDTLDTLRSLRRDLYNSPNDVSEAVGEIE
jgi:uncharacterized membrane protein YuzA (DUF378 family)